MAYLKQLEHICQTSPRKATVELFNRHNAPCRKFCRQCGKIRLRQLIWSEKESDEFRSKSKK